LDVNKQHIYNNLETKDFTEYSSNFLSKRVKLNDNTMSIWEKLDYHEVNPLGKIVNPYIEEFNSKPLEFDNKADYIEWSEKIKVGIKEKIKKKLTPMEYNITQNKANEKPFTGIYCNHYGIGVYSCKVCTQRLFSNTQKTKADSGWANFWNFLPFSLKLKSDFMDNWKFKARSGLFNLQNDNLPDPIHRVACSNVSIIFLIFIIILH